MDPLKTEPSAKKFGTAGCKRKDTQGDINLTTGKNRSGSCCNGECRVRGGLRLTRGCAATFGGKGRGERAAIAGELTGAYLLERMDRTFSKWWLSRVTPFRDVLPEKLVAEREAMERQQEYNRNYADFL